MKILTPLKEDKFIDFGQDTHYAFSAKQNGIYNSDNLLVSITYKGVDEYEILKEKENPKPDKPQQVFIAHGYGLTTGSIEYQYQ